MLCNGVQAQLPDPLNTWELVPTPPIHLRGLTYMNGQFVGVGVSTNIIVSSNGVHWSVVPNGLNGYYEMLLGVAAGADQFVAVGVGLGGTVLTSPDGSQWTRRSTGAPNLHQELWAVTYGGGAFVAVGFQNPGGAVAAVSSNGIDWESFNLPIQTTPRNIAYGNGRYVAAGAPVSMSSTNGKDWTPINSLLAQGIAYGEGQFIATLTTSGFKSSNGVDWAQFPLPVLGSGIQNYYTARYANADLRLMGLFPESASNSIRETGSLCDKPSGCIDGGVGD